MFFWNIFKSSSQIRISTIFNGGDDVQWPWRKWGKMRNWTLCAHVLYVPVSPISNLQPLLNYFTFRLKDFCRLKASAESTSWQKSRHYYCTSCDTDCHCKYLLKYLPILKYSQKMVNQYHTGSWDTCDQRLQLSRIGKIIWTIYQTTVVRKLSIIAYSSSFIKFV